jgi:phage portal protein BeeE
MWNIWPFGRKSEPSEQRSMTIDEFLAMAGIPNTGSGEYVSAGTAESLPAVMNAVSVISEAVATMPCYLYRVRNDNGREARMAEQSPGGFSPERAAERLPDALPV